MLVALGQENDPLSEPFSCRSAAPFPMLSFVPLTVAQRMPTPAPGPSWAVPAVQQLVSVRSGPARPRPARVLIPGLSEDPTLNSSCNTGKRSNWGIFYIINSDEHPPHPLSPPLHSPSLCMSLTPTLFSNLSWLLHILGLFHPFGKSLTFFSLFHSGCVVCLIIHIWDPNNKVKSV